MNTVSLCTARVACWTALLTSCSTSADTCTEHTEADLCEILLSGSPCTGDDCFVTIECGGVPSDGDFVCDRDAVHTSTRSAYVTTCEAWGGYMEDVELDWAYDFSCLDSSALTYCTLPPRCP